MYKVIDVCNLSVALTTPMNDDFNINKTILMDQ